MKKVISIIALISVFTTVFVGCEDINDSVISNSSIETNLTETITTTTQPTTSESSLSTSLNTQPTESPSTEPTSQETQKQPNSPAPTISMQVDETIPENDAVIQIPLFNANSNAGADALNIRIANELQSAYSQYKQNISANSDDFGWIDISSHTFNNNKYVQVISMLGEYPSYGTDGKIFSYNYDIDNGTALDISTAMNRFSVTQSDLETAMATAFKPESETRRLVSVEPTAFRIGDDNALYVYMYVYSDDPNSTPDTRIWIYNSQSKVCSQYDKNTTFQ